MQQFLSNNISIPNDNIEQLKKDLQTCRQRFAGIFDTTAIGMAIVTPKGKFLQVNDVFASTIGYTKKELLKKTFQDITHPDDLEEDMKSLKRMLSGEINAIQREKRHVRKDGSIMWARLSVSLSRDTEGNPINLVGQVEDISERKEAELKLKETIERYDLVLKGTDDGVWDWNIVTNEVYFSSRWKEMLGFNDDEIKNDFSEWQNRIHPDDVEKTLKHVQDYVAAKGQEAFEMEFRMGHKDGSWVDILARAYLAINEEGESIRLVGTHIDITDRKQFEKRLANSETRFRSLFDNMSSGVAVYRYDEEKDDFVFVDLNKAGEKISKVKKEDIVGKGVKEVFSAVEEIGLYKMFEEVNKTGEPQDHPTVFYQDEKMANWVENYVYKLPTGEVVAVYDDVTAEKQAEANLKAKVDELKDFNEIMTGRELKMVELKQKIKDLGGEV